MLKAATLVLVYYITDNGIPRWYPQTLASEWDPAIPQQSLRGRKGVSYYSISFCGSKSW